MWLTYLRSYVFKPFIAENSLLNCQNRNSNEQHTRFLVRLFKHYNISYFSQDIAHFI